MFDIGISELLVVFVVGLLILGPERLPHAAKTAGLWIRKIRRSINSVQREINAQLDDEEMQRKILETNKKELAEHSTKPADESSGERVIQNTITPLPTKELQPVKPAPEETNANNIAPEPLNTQQIDTSKNAS
ncbi:Sec-independent protein translocase protein TatB [Marinomonas sp.]